MYVALFRRFSISLPEKLGGVDPMFGSNSVDHSFRILVFQYVGDFDVVAICNQILEDKPDLSEWTLKYKAFGRDIEYSWLARNMQVRIM